jgi:hypothetical protein
VDGPWQSISGVELERTYVGHDRMTENVPAQSAVYAWKRRFQPPRGIEADPVALAAWIAETVKTPSAILPPRELSHYLLLHGISIGGAPLTDEKLNTLKLWATEAKSRRWLLTIVQSIGTLAPPLYIGETDNLARRVKDHLGYKTGFSLTLRDKLNLTWRDCELWYCSVPGEFLAIDAKGRRTLVELLVARLTVAGCTSRPG